ncbi:hypothetical protein ATANTOWER_014689 [Ataeniobius toweri]|uniref:Uncharacterized protein n=1 Tax=Ataeniobius toweri TaxID=208326 RepID=A0ABU7BSV4_9TELE|nr:hypothetical protein [Ataeniobius toweri]
MEKARNSWQPPRLARGEEGFFSLILGFTTPSRPSQRALDEIAASMRRSPAPSSTRLSTEARHGFPTPNHVPGPVAEGFMEEPPPHPNPVPSSVPEGSQAESPTHSVPVREGLVNGLPPLPAPVPGPVVEGSEDELPQICRRSPQPHRRSQRSSHSASELHHGFSWAIKHPSIVYTRLFLKGRRGPTDRHQPPCEDNWPGPPNRRRSGSGGGGQAPPEKKLKHREKASPQEKEWRQLYVGGVGGKQRRKQQEAFMQVVENGADGACTSLDPQKLLLDPLVRHYEAP